MSSLYYLGRLWMVVLVLLTASPLSIHSGVLPAPAESNAEVCTWQGANSVWEISSNWSCGHVPTDADDVVIGAVGVPPGLSSNTTIKSLSLSGNTLTVKTSGVLNGSEALTVTGDAAVQNAGVINMSLAVTAGTLEAGGTWNGDATIASLAKLTVNANTMRLSGNLDVDGTLDGKTSGNTLFFGGEVFRNDGLVQVGIVKFNRPGQQTILGSGEWSGADQIRIVSGSTTSLASDLTLDMELYIEAGSTVDVGDHTLTMNGAPFYSMCIYNNQISQLAGTGAVRTQGALSIQSCGTFSPSLEVVTGTTTVSTAVFSGTLGVLAGATLEVTSASVTVHGNVTITGTLAGGSPDATVTFIGGEFINNGAVTGGKVMFAGATQTLRGAGYFDANNRALVGDGTTLTLDSDHQMGEVFIQSTGVFVLDGHRLGLSAAGTSGTPLTNNGTLDTSQSTIIYNGNVTQTLAYLNVNYHHLIISNPVVVKAPTDDVNITGDFTNQGVFDPGLGTLVFNGSAPQAVGGSATTFANLTINNSTGVNLTTDATVTGVLTLDGDLFTGINVVTAGGTSAGAFDVFGRVRRNDLAPGVTRSFGNPFVTLTFNAGTPPSEVTVALSSSPPENLPEAVQRTYTITPTGGSSYSANLRLHYRDSELNGLAEDQLSLWKSVDGLPTWRPQHRAAWDETENWVESSGVTSFSNWALATSNTYYTLTMATDGTGNGTLAPAVGAHSYLSGTVVALTATPDGLSTFDGWSGDVTATTNPITITMDGHKAVTATFNTYYTLTMATDGTGSGTLDPAVGAHSYLSGTVVALMATPGVGSRFDGWSGDVAATTNPAFVVMNGPKVVTATFTLVSDTYYTLTIAHAGTGSGTTDPVAGAHSYLDGTVVTLMATPDGVSTFDGWSGDVATTTNPITITMDGDKAVTANFTALSPQLTYTLVANTVGNGTVTRVPNATVYASGTVVTLTATPDTGWAFTAWSGDLNGTDNPAHITMDGNKTVTATFELIQYRLYLPIVVR